MEVVGADQKERQISNLRRRGSSKLQLSGAFCRKARRLSHSLRFDERTVPEPPGLFAWFRRYSREGRLELRHTPHREGFPPDDDRSPQTLSQRPGALVVSYGLARLVDS